MWPSNACQSSPIESRVCCWPRRAFGCVSISVMLPALFPFGILEASGDEDVFCLLSCFVRSFVRLFVWMYDSGERGLTIFAASSL